MTFSMVTYPDVTCLCRTAVFNRQKEMAKVGFELHTQAVLRGYRLLSTMPLFNIRLSGEDRPFEAKICIPLEDGEKDDVHSEDVQVVPGGNMFSMLFYGGYENSTELDRAHRLFRNRLREEKLTPTGPMRVYWIVSSYSGSRFRAEDYVFRMAIPIAKQTADENDAATI